MRRGARLWGALGKVRGRTPAELRVRGAQALAAALERRGWSALGREPTDAELAALLSGPARGGPEAMLAHFRTRAAPRFFAAFDDRGATLAELRRRWPDAERAAVARADRILAGRFDLLGHADLDFGDPIDWWYDPVSGKRAPAAHWSRIRYLDAGAVGDHKVIWELNRHQYFLTLGRAYWQTGDEAYARALAKHLTSWMDANPPKLGINWASSLEVAFRAISWLWALHFFRHSAALTPALFRRALKFLYLHGRHLETYLSTYFSPNTHLTGEALGLYYLGTLLPELGCADRWREIGWRILAEQLERQVLPDGVYFEQASYYARYTADFYLHALVLRRANGAEIPGGIARRLGALLDYLMWLTRPDGSTPLIGDDDGGRLAPLDERRPDDFRAALATAAVLYRRPDYAYVAAGPAEETLWLLGPEGLRSFDGLPATPPGEVSHAFPDGGYYVMRDGWGRDADFAVVDCGPHGAPAPGHAHADALAIELAVGGRAVLVDSGTYTYTAEPPERDHFRAAAAHNTVTVDGESSSVPAGAFAWRDVARPSAVAWEAHEWFAYFEGRHDGFERLAAPAVHVRSVLFLKGRYLVVRDLVSSRGYHRVDVHFHGAAGTAARREGDHRVALHDAASGSPLLGIACFAEGGSFSCAPGWVSRAYGAREAAPVCSYERAAPGVHEIVSVLVPARAGSVRAEEVATDGGRAITLTGDSAVDVLLLGGGAAAAAGVRSDAAWAWVRRAGDGTVTEFLLLGGRTLSVDGALTVCAPAPVRYLAGRRDGVRLDVRCEPAPRADAVAIEVPVGVVDVVVNGAHRTPAARGAPVGGALADTR